MLYSTVDELLSVALGSALIASNGLNIIHDNPVANKVLVVFLLIVLPLLALIDVMSFNLMFGTSENDVSIIPLITYALIIANRNTASSMVNPDDRDKATKIAIAGLVCTIVLNLIALKTHVHFHYHTRDYRELEY
jgi:hypothetical protein